MVQPKGLYIPPACVATYYFKVASEMKDFVSWRGLLDKRVFNDVWLRVEDEVDDECKAKDKG